MEEHYVQIVFILNKDTLANRSRLEWFKKRIAKWKQTIEYADCGMMLLDGAIALEAKSELLAAKGQLEGLLAKEHRRKGVCLRDIEAGH
jgi:hypothetical protein